MSTVPLLPRWVVNGEGLLFVFAKQAIPEDRIVSYSGVDGNPIRVKLEEKPFEVRDSGAFLFRYKKI